MNNSAYILLPFFVLFLPIHASPSSTPPSSTLSQHLPRAIIIGVKKAGTRALLEYLRLHPNVSAPGPEVHYFDRHYERGTEWYRRQMPYTKEGMLTVEKTPSYFVTRGVPARVRALDPNMKLIVVVRDPITRAISDYTQTSSKRADMPSFENLAFNSSTGEVDRSWGAIKIGIYARHVKKWLTHFPIHQIHFVDGEQLVHRPLEAMRPLEIFLGLPPYIDDRHFVREEGKKFPCVHRDGREVHCLGKTKGRRHPLLGEETWWRLRTFFSPLNEQFYKLVRQRFNW